MNRWGLIGYQDSSKREANVTIQIVKPPVAKVERVSYTPKPLAVIGTLARAYEHEFSTKLPSRRDQLKHFEELSKTVLAGAFEMVHFLWLITDVTRAFTHQLVRYRVGTSFVQESLRFSAQIEPRVLSTVPENDEAEETYRAGIEPAIWAYQLLLEQGVAVEDARGLLPTNILTKIFFGCSLRTLIRVYEQRMCIQAQQAEWPTVLQQMKQQLCDIDTAFDAVLKMRCEKTGECLFRSMWDRPCPYRKESSGTRIGDATKFKHPDTRSAIQSSLL